MSNVQELVTHIGDLATLIANDVQTINNELAQVQAQVNNPPATPQPTQPVQEIATFSEHLYDVVPTSQSLKVGTDTYAPLVQYKRIQFRFKNYDEGLAGFKDVAISYRPEFVLNNSNSTGKSPEPNKWFIIGGGLPDGLVLNGYGFITGTPTDKGVGNFQVALSHPDFQNTVNIHISISAEKIDLNAYMDTIKYSRDPNSDPNSSYQNFILTSDTSKLPTSITIPAGGVKFIDSNYAGNPTLYGSWMQNDYASGNYNQLVSQQDCTLANQVGTLGFYLYGTSSSTLTIVYQGTEYTRTLPYPT